jgi:hypothetical protein
MTLAMQLSETGAFVEDRDSKSVVRSRNTMANQQNLEREMRRFSLRHGEDANDGQDDAETGPGDLRKRAVSEGKMDVRMAEGIVERLREEKVALTGELVHANKDLHWTKLGVSRAGVSVSERDVVSAEGDARTCYFRVHAKREEVWQAKEAKRRAVRRLRAAEAAERAGGHAMEIKKCELAIGKMREEIEMHRGALRDEINEEASWKHAHPASQEAHVERAECLETVKHEYGVDVGEGS